MAQNIVGEGKVYEGCIDEQGNPLVLVDGAELDPHHRLYMHHDAFAWGHEGPGAAQLALALVADASSPNDAVVVHHDFKRLVVRQWAADKPWKITQAQILRRIGRHYP